VTAIDYLHANKMYVVGGLIVGNPQDTRASIEANLAFARRYVDVPYIQHPTPYPRTPMTKTFREQGLIINERLEDTTAPPPVVRTAHLESDEIEFLRWRADRWIKLKHLPVALVHTPRFALRNGLKMLRHTFREPLSGLSWVSRTSEGPSSAIARFAEPSGCICNSMVDTSEPAL